MSLDTKYRPLRYADVLGQDATVEVCKQIVKEGKAFHQSYVFAGAHGSGKTTTARIFARAMLCDAPVDGEPCDKCPSCFAVLSGASEAFLEVDAATNSGKDHVRRIMEEAQFGTVSGKRRIYLWDESQELSKSAQDAMLKPMEDNIRGSQDRQLVCIFATTEPNKMRGAIMSRCAPAFKIAINSPETIAKRLAFVCEQEGIEHDLATLSLIAEVSECHVRDSIKAVEGVSMLGAINRENVERYLHLDANTLYLDVLESLGADLPRALQTVEKINEQVSPGVAYRHLADICMMAYRLAHLGQASVPSYWDRERLLRAGEFHKEFLVEFAQRFAGRPMRPTTSMLACDVAALHQKRAGVQVVATSTVQVSVPAHAPPMAPVAPQPVSEPPAPSPAPEAPETPEPSVSEVPNPETTLEDPTPVEAPQPPIEPLPKAEEVKVVESQNEAAQSGSMQSEAHINEMGVYINPQAQQMSRGTPRQKGNGVGTMTIAFFTETLHRRVIELTQERSTSGRSARRDDVGSS